MPAGRNPGAAQQPRERSAADILIDRQTARPAGGERKGLCVDAAVADVMATYGAGVMFNPAYPTTDGCIPWALFWLLHGQIERRLSLERVQFTTALMLGIGRLFGNDSAKAFADEDIQRALP